MEIKDRELHRIAITAIIYNDKGQYLVTKRSPHKKVWPNKWTVPGGGLEVDDYINEPVSTKARQWYYALEKALRREVTEEVNVEISKPIYLLDLTFIRPDNIPVLVLSYYAKYLSGEVKLDDDAVEYKWATLAEAKDLDMIEGIWEELELVDKTLREQGDS
ncbi:MAG: NUDIX domain-containing protein [Candidatus Vogelbacteria bacterium]|nr:NUDIX domain-containing protein [Candidatus Vogelbacteria bacterium]